MDENLESLRQAATCAICTEFYNRPKKLPGCSHVFCLRCLQRHMQVNCTRNFPPCPMCRKPISISRNEVFNLGPAIAERTIVDLVKQFETCDICGTKSNPNYRCENCSAYVCNDCLPRHKALKRSHNIVPIIPTRGNSKGPVEVPSPCLVHRDQPLDLYCIKCRRMLCIHCKTYSHTQCATQCVNKEFERGFLKFFIDSSEDRQHRLKSNTLGNIFYIKDVANAARQWLNEIKIEVQSCINFFKDNKIRLEHVGEEANEGHRLKTIVSKFDSIVSFGEDCEVNIDTLLDTDTTDVQLATDVLNSDQHYLLVFHYRQKYSSYGMFTGSQKCVLTEFLGRCTCIMHTQCFDIEGEPFLPHNEMTRGIRDNDIDDGKQSNLKRTLVNNMLVTTFTGERLFFFEEQRPGKYAHFKNTFDANIIDNCLYTNTILTRYEIPEEKAKSWSRVIKEAFRFVENPPSSSKSHSTTIDVERYDPNLPYNRSRPYQITLKFTDRCPFLTTQYSLEGNNLSTSTTNGPYVIHCIGNREYCAGLESVFLCIDDANSYADHMCGISINAEVAKFNQTVPINRGSTITSNLHIIDENKQFEIFKYFSLTVYRSKPAANDIPDAFLVAEKDVENNFTVHVPVTFFTTYLLCHLESGLYFAKHEDNGDMIIGNITFNVHEITPNIVHRVRQSDTDISLNRINPFTMIQKTDKNVIVVCSVGGDNTKIVLIQIDKEGPEAIEILTIDYALSEHRVYGKPEADDMKTEMYATQVAAAEPGHTDRKSKHDKTVDAESNIKINMVGEINDKIDESTLRKIADARVGDLEMDKEGNIMFLLYNDDENDHCSSGFRGGSRVSLAPPSESTLLQFHDEIYEIGPFGELELCVQKSSIRPCYCACTKYLMP